ncbi:MAG: glycosyltransferase [bacterium]|nr:glycosyltransferase [bacterium]
MNTKIKVLYAITKTDLGGAQKYVSDLAANLDRQRFEAKIIYGGQDLRWLSNRVWPWALFLNDWLAILELRKFYKKEQPQIVHLNSSKAGIIGSLAAILISPRPKIIFTAHGWVFNPTNALSLAVRWFYILLHKIAAFFQDHIICVSEYDHQLALRYHIAPPKKITTIHNGIDSGLKFLDKESAKRDIIKIIPNSKFQILDSKLPWIGSIGRLVKEKNYETLIEAAAIIPNACFFIIGSGSEQRNLESRIKNLKLEKRFFLLNPSGNDAQYLKAFDIFAMSSIKEGLPYILMEAMLAERPIIITEAGGMPEMIKNHENGLMVAQKNPKMLAQAISGLLENPAIAQSLSQTGKKVVRDKFSLQKMIFETKQVYQNLL